MHLRHAHGEALDDDMCIERLHDVSRDQTLVHSRVLVLLQLRQLVLPNINHRDGSRKACVRARAIKPSKRRDESRRRRGRCDGRGRSKDSARRDEVKKGGGGGEEMNVGHACIPGLRSGRAKEMVVARTLDAGVRHVDWRRAPDFNHVVTCQGSARPTPAFLLLETRSFFFITCASLGWTKMAFEIHSG